MRGFAKWGSVLLIAIGSTIGGVIGSTVGRRLPPPVLRGVIQEGMDAQRMVNYTYSAAIEAIALAPKAPFIYAAGQIERYKSIWQTAATTTAPRCPSVSPSSAPPSSAPRNRSAQPNRPAKPASIPRSPPSPRPLTM